MSSTSRLQSAINTIRGSRVFTSQFLKDLGDGEWFWSPPQYTTHLAWQVGHIATAQYSLCLCRARGRTSADESLISDKFMETFTLGSKPMGDPAQNPPLDEIKRVFNAVHEQTIAELAGRTDAELDLPLDEPHPRFKTKLAAVEFSPLHEMVHAGQIAMLRRLMGKAPLR